MAAAIETAASGLDAAPVAVLDVGRRRPFAHSTAATAWRATPVRTLSARRWVAMVRGSVPNDALRS
ncbi:MAG TPA: hypothetical protein VFI47_22050, partial [Acidimicrobiales bacterium]|nr:hypothetical protein [Acidimicrobiales bacterium]